MQLTQHFTLAELTKSSTAERLGLDNTPPPEVLPALTSTAEMLERIRSTLGVPVTVTRMTAGVSQSTTLERVLPGWHAMSFGLWLTMPTRKHVPVRTQVFWDFLLRTFGGKDRDPW